MLWDETLRGAMAMLAAAAPYAAALVLLAGLVLVGDRGSRLALKRNSPSLAALCIFSFAIGSCLITWHLLVSPILSFSGLALSVAYPAVIMYWAAWLLTGVLIAAKRIVYDGRRQITNGRP